MNICVIGAGYVGLTTAAVLADWGHQVQVVDVDQSKIDALHQGKLPIYEPGLERMVQRNTSRHRLHFSTRVRDGIEENPVIFIAVGTPPLPNGSSNLSHVHDVVRMIAGCCIGSSEHKLIITKSTVPLGTNEQIYQTFIDHGIHEKSFDVVSNPEFLREGSAIYDLLHPDRIVVGTKTERPVETIKQLYRCIEAPYVFTTLTGAEMIKYASNAFLASKISFINEIARICDSCQVSIEDVAEGIGADRRIGPHFLKAGIGYGGSCFPKDVHSLMYSAKQKQVDTPLLESVTAVNQSQIEYVVQKLQTKLQTLGGKQVTVWGLSFKPDTDDTRLSPALSIIGSLLQRGCQVHVFDPVVKHAPPGTQFYSDMYDAVNQSNALLIATEWKQFEHCDWRKVKSNMHGNIIVDGRNFLDSTMLQAYGFVYLGVGKS